LTFSDRVDALSLAAVMSWRDFRAVYPTRIYLFTALPRAVLQTAFFALVGYYGGGRHGREFAFVGACTQVIVLATVVRAPDIVVDDRIMGTMHRLRLGIVSLPALFAARWVVYVAAGIVDALVALVIVGPLVGEAELVPRLLMAAPLFVLIAATTSALGLVVAAVSLTERADVLLTNFASYGMLVFCGVIAPTSVLGGVGEQVVRALPLTNGLRAVRAVVAGEPWAGDAALELAVGAGWALAAVVVIRLQAERARRLGSDELL
jgi:ABC-2 type transport system permease protein